MSVKYNIAHAIARLVFDMPARKQTLGELAAKLEESGQNVEQVLASASGNTAHYQTLSHIIGIERWGQRRLRVALGEPLIMDEHEPYCPSVALFWDDLRQVFKTTRAETVALVHVLEQAGIDTSVAVRHNELGILSVHGWTRYLTMHAVLESNRKIART